MDAVVFAGISLVLGTACRQLFNGTGVPYTVVLLVIGILLGSLEVSWTNDSACCPWSFNFHILYWNFFEAGTGKHHCCLDVTDPVAVVALLKELGSSKKLTNIIDGVSVVVFQLFFRMVMGNDSGWGSTINFLAQNSFGAGIGLAFGIASVLVLRFVFNDTVVQITVTLSVSHFAYYTCSSPHLNRQCENPRSLENLRVFYQL